MCTRTWACTQARPTAHRDGNESIDPVTPTCGPSTRSGRRIPGFEAALAGGVTTLQILPGSGEPDRRPRRHRQERARDDHQAMKFPGAPHGLKMACGENPEARLRRQAPCPQTRMGKSPATARHSPTRRTTSEDWRSTSASSRMETEGQAREAMTRTTTGRRCRRSATSSSRRSPACSRRHPRAHPLLSRRRDGDDARHRRRSSASGSPRSTTASRRTSSPIGWPQRGHVRRAVGRLVGLQDGGLRRHPGKPRARRPPEGGCADRAFGFRGGHPAAQPGGREGDDARPARRA